MDGNYCNFTIFSKLSFFVKIRPLMDGNEEHNELCMAIKNVKIRPLMDGNHFLLGEYFIYNVLKSDH